MSFNKVSDDDITDFGLDFGGLFCIIRKNKQLGRKMGFWVKGVV
jgi:hypothetical protein